MHYSVLKNEVIENLNLKSDGIYLDGTVGYAGHSSEILRNIPAGFLYAFDQDENAVKYSTEKLSSIASNFKVIKNNFCNIDKEITDIKFDGMLFDLGFSSPQIDNAQRGFSFMNNGPLDMRMSQKGKSAKDIIDTYSFDELSEIFFRYGEEKLSKVIAKKIIEKKEYIHTTFELVEAIKEAVGANYFYKQHPERKIFQALRIEVNEELKVIEEILPKAIELLAPKGRICVITFHSLEDRVVKSIFKKFSDVDPLVKGLPVVPDEYKPLIKLINKSPILPGEKELSENSRSASAKLRVIERL